MATQHYGPYDSEMPDSLSPLTFSSSSSLRSVFDRSCYAGQELQRCVESADWSALGELLSSLDPADWGRNSDLLDRNVHCLPVLHTMIRRQAPLELIELALEKGADINRRVDRKNPANNDEFLGFSPLVMAVHCRNGPLVELLCKRGASREGALLRALQVEQDDPQLPLTKFLLESGEKLADVPRGSLRGANLRGLIIEEDLSERDLSGVNLIDSDLSRSCLDEATLTGAWYSPRTKFPHEVMVRERGLVKAKRHPLENDDRYLSDPELRVMVTRELRELRLDSLRNWVALSEIHQIIDLSGSYPDALLYVAAYKDAVVDYPSGSGLPLTKLLPRLLFAYPDITIPNLLSAIEHKMDTYRDAPPGNHYNMAEMLALAAHPRDPGLESPRIGALSTAITSVDRWIGRENVALKVTNRTISLWGEIGRLTHSFGSLKFDTERVPATLADGSRRPQPALIERFGFMYISDRSSDFLPSQEGLRMHDLGPGFAVSPNSKTFTYKPSGMYGSGEGIADYRSQMYVEVRRSYYLVSDPEWGSLVIRSSSPDFGRDKLPFVAVWSPGGAGNGFTVEELKNFNPKLLESGGFRSVTHPALYRDNPQFERYLGGLLQNFRGLLDEYDEWKFDTRIDSAWQTESAESEEATLVGGHLSPGFSDLVSLLERKLVMNLERMLRGEPPAPMQALAVMPRRMPPWKPELLRPALDGHPAQHQVPVTHVVVEALRDLIDGRVDQNTVDTTGVYNLLQRALDTQGVLTMVNRESPEW